MLGACHSDLLPVLLSFYFFFFQRLIFEVALLMSPDFDTCFTLTRIYKIWSEILGFSPQKNACAKKTKCGPSFGQVF